MDMLEIHSSARDSFVVAHQEFLYQWRGDDKIVYGFVEGRDDPSFYRGFISGILPDEWKVKLIISGNKNNVFKVFDAMDWSRFPKKRLCFFVDRDLSIFLDEETRSEDNLYITDSYSIENEAVNFETMEVVLSDVFGINDLNPTEIDSIRNLFEDSLGAFVESVAPVMAQILIWRRAGIDVSLSNIDPKEYFKFEQSHIKLKERYKSQRERIRYAARRVDAPMSDESEIAKVEREFRRLQGLEKYIRGKYLIWFFIQCIKEIHKAIPGLCPRYNRAPKVHIDLNAVNGMMVIAPRVRCPYSLRSFLENNFVSYIKEVTVAA